MVGHRGARALARGAAVWFFCSYSVSDGRLIARKADVIDLRGEDISAQEAEALAAKYPGKTVLWDVPLSGGSRPSSTESLSLSSLSADDIPLFACFPNLKSIDASGCTDYEALLALRSAYPALDLTAFVTVSGKAVPMDARAPCCAPIHRLRSFWKHCPSFPSFTGYPLRAARYPMKCRMHSPRRFRRFPSAGMWKCSA